MQPAFTHTRNRMILINVIVNLWRCRTVQKRVHESLRIHALWWVRFFTHLTS